MFVIFNGQLVNERSVKISPFDHGFLYGDGVYETMRTYRGKIWQLPFHLARLNHSLGLAKIFIPWSNEQLEKMILRLMEKNRFSEARIRLMITRGNSPSKGAKFMPSRATKPTLLITAYPIPRFRPGPVTTGSAVFFQVVRCFPEVKTTSLFPLIMARLHAEREGAADALLIDEKGFVREGATSNLFIVSAERKRSAAIIITASRHILDGITRDYILDLAKKKFKIEFRPLRKSEILQADEVFITNAPRGIIAITSVEGEKIGSGKPGKVTKYLKKKFDQSIYKL